MDGVLLFPRVLRHGGGGTWDTSPTLQWLLHIPCAIYMVEGCRHFVFDYKMLAKLHDARLVVEYLLGIHAQHDLVPHPGPLSLGPGDASSSDTELLCSLIDCA